MSVFNPSKMEKNLVIGQSLSSQYISSLYLYYCSRHFKMQNGYRVDGKDVKYNAWCTML